MENQREDQRTQNTANQDVNHRQNSQNTTGKHRDQQAQATAHEKDLNRGSDKQFHTRDAIHETESETRAQHQREGQKSETKAKGNHSSETNLAVRSERNQQR